MTTPDTPATPSLDAPEPSSPALALPPRRSLRTILEQPFTLGLLATIGALLAIVLGMAVTSIATILIYIVLAAFIALGLDPVVRRLERRGMKRAWAITLVSAAFAILLAVVVFFVLPPAISQLIAAIKAIPQTLTDIENSEWYAGIEAQYGDVIGTLINNLQSFFSDPANIAALGGGALAVGVSLAEAISGGLIVAVLTLYFLASLEGTKTALLRLSPARNRPAATALTNQITDSIGGYLIGMVILAGCNAVVATTLHLVLGLPFPALMGLLAFGITLIPLIGSVLYWITASVIALFTSPTLALIFAIVYLIYIQFEAYLLTPRVMNKTISVPGALVVIGAMVGGTLLGLLGALVAIPITAGILLIIKQVAIPRQDAKM